MLDCFLPGLLQGPETCLHVWTHCTSIAFTNPSLHEHQDLEDQQALNRVISNTSFSAITGQDPPEELKLEDQEKRTTPFMYTWFDQLVL